MSILRSAHFVKYSINAARNIIKSQPKIVDKTILERCSRLILEGTDRSYADLASSHSNINFEKYIQRLDEDVRRQGRISSKELLDVVDEMRSLRHATSTQCLMVIRCCGSLVPDEIPEIRTRLVNEMWDTFEKIGVPLDISHYNALLRVYLENEHNFSPTEFLTTLEKKGVEPNRVTYQRLILAYCQKGEIEGATRILEFMKDKQMPVNESVFNALIVGHSQADDMESAKSILSVMQQANIEPSNETYAALLCGYARSGSLENINATLKECREKGIELLDKDILEVVFTLAVNNHSEHLDEVLSNIQQGYGYNQDAKNVILRLIVKGEDKAALKVLGSMMPPTVGGPSGIFLIRQMVKLNPPLERILSLCNTLKESQTNEYALQHAVEASLLNGTNPELSLKLLSSLALQEPVCQHYYWPVLVQFAKANNPQGVYTTLRQLSEEVGQLVSTETLKDYVLPYMQQMNQNFLDLRNGGVTMGAASAAYASYLLANNNIKDAANQVLQYRANYNSNNLKRSLINAFINTNDVESLVTIIEVLIAGEKDGTEHPAEEVLQGIIGSLRGEDRVKIIEDILQRFLERGIGLSNEAAEQLQNSVGGEKLTQEISTLLSQLTSPDLVPKEIARPSQRKFVDSRNEEIILSSIKNAEKRGDETSSLKRDLLYYYSRNKEMEKLDELVNKLKEEGYEFTFGILATLLDASANKENLSQATEFYNSIIALKSDEQLDDNKLVKYAYLLAKNDQLEVAMNLFKTTAKDISKRDFVYTTTCWKLLNVLAEKGNVEKLKELFDLMKNNKFIEPNNVLLGSLIKVHLVNDDLEGALKQFEECCSLYRSTPWKNELACRFIQKEDANSLQRLTDLSTQIHGEMNSLYDLVLSFIECGRIRQAKKILHTPGLRLPNLRINHTCEKYTMQGRVKDLENFVEVTKDLAHIDRSEIYYHLLLSYSNANEVDKAIGLWTQMQDEDVQPSEQFLFTLGTLLTKNQRPLPFAMPKKREEESSEELNDTKQLSIPYARLSALRSYRKAIYGKETDVALEIKNRLKESDFSDNDRFRLINLLIHNGRLREATQMLETLFQKGYTNIRKGVLDNLLNSLAKLGDLDLLDSIGKYLSPNIKRNVSYINRRAHCMVMAGKSEELLQALSEGITNARTPQEISRVADDFPRGGIFAVLSNNPEKLPQVEELAMKYKEKGETQPLMVLWNYHVIENNEAKAQELWNLIDRYDNLMLLPIVASAKSKQDEQLILNTLEHCKKNNVPSDLMIPLYNGLMDILVSQNRESEAEQILEETLEYHDINVLSVKVLLRLQKALEFAGKSFKYTIPKRPRNQSPPSFDIERNNMVQN